MSRQKRKKFAVNLESDNVIQDGKENFKKLKGQWKKEHFKNDHPLVLELGCGRGEYTVGLAKHFPDKNFIGIDVKGDRIYKGSQEAYEYNLQNVAFLRIMIQDIEDHFGENEVDEIWITFPDPRPKKRDIKRRLTSNRFMEAYYRLLKNEGKIFFKTDSEPLFDFTLEVMEELSKTNFEYTKDLYNSELNKEHFGIQTRYEKKFTSEGFNINYLRFNIRKP